MMSSRERYKSLSKIFASQFTTGKRFEDYENTFNHVTYAGRLIQPIQMVRTVQELGISLNTNFSVEVNSVSQQKHVYYILSPKTMFRGPKPQHFVLLYTTFI